MATSSTGTKRIRPLSEHVVNKIAAGEIIVAPVNALKELIENAVDAGSTSLEVLVKDGGMKLLQITDNGSGINVCSHPIIYTQKLTVEKREDLPILCERHTTSKLTKFEDLMSMNTYGFRGEALASISHIAHLTITTKTHDSTCAYKAYYMDGKLAAPKPGQSSDPKPCAGRQGTQIQVEDLFYNTLGRNKAYRSSSEEYAKILDMVGRYAVHCKGVAFSCKKHGESGASLSVPGQADIIDRIRLVHNSTIANDLFSFNVTNETLGFRSDGWASSANYSGKKTTLLLFINHRSVESSAVRKAVEQTYQPFLPRQGHPFVYLSLNIDPHRVDVNVHPTKKEVNFLNEEDIITLICDEIRTSLGKVDTSRTFMTQSLLSSKRPTNTSAPDTPMPDISAVSESPSDVTPSRPPQSRTRKTYENNLVRTDDRARKITSMLPPARPGSPDKSALPSDEPTYTNTDKEHTLCRLTSVKSLRAAVRDNIHNDLTTSISAHTFVGIVDFSRRIAAIQSSVKLLLIDYGMFSAEYFYQLGLTDFGNFGVIRLNPPLDLREVLVIGAKKEEAIMTDAQRRSNEEFDWDSAVERVHAQLMDRREMLMEYFSLEISEEGMVEALPLLVKGYTPCMQKMPGFLLKLGPKVDWGDEQGCFETFLRELAKWYVPEPLGNEEAELSEEDMGRRRHVQRALEHVLFPAFKARLIATKDMRRGVLEVADLKGLYRVFERC